MPWPDVFPLPCNLVVPRLVLPGRGPKKRDMKSERVGDGRALKRVNVRPCWPGRGGGHGRQTHHRAPVYGTSLVCGRVAGQTMARDLLYV